MTIEALKKKCGQTRSILQKFNAKVVRDSNKRRMVRFKSTVLVDIPEDKFIEDPLGVMRTVLFKISNCSDSIVKSGVAVLKKIEKGLE